MVAKISALNLKQNFNKLRSEVKFDEFFFESTQATSEIAS